MLALHVLAVMGALIWMAASLLLMFGGFIVAVTSPSAPPGVAQLGAGLGIVVGAGISLAYAFQVLQACAPR